LWIDVSEAPLMVQSNECIGDTLVQITI